MNIIFILPPLSSVIDEELDDSVWYLRYIIWILAGELFLIIMLVFIVHIEIFMMRPLVK